MSRKPNDLPEGDDGRTIASMNVEGMPWYKPSDRPDERTDEASPDAPRAQLSPEETRYATWGALKAALLVVGVLCAGLVLFILFAQFVWFP